MKKGIVALSACAVFVMIFMYVDRPKPASFEAVTESPFALASSSITPHSESDNAALHDTSEMLDAHIHAFDDGKTFMTMAGQINPAVLYVSPQEQIRLANHESYDIQLKTQDGKYYSELTTGNGKETFFSAPAFVGRYEFISSHNSHIVGTVVVEE